MRRITTAAALAALALLVLPAFPQEAPNLPGLPKPAKCVHRILQRKDAIKIITTESAADGQRTTKLNYVPGGGGQVLKTSTGSAKRYALWSDPVLVVTTLVKSDAGTQTRTNCAATMRVVLDRR